MSRSLASRSQRVAADLRLCSYFTHTGGSDSRESVLLDNDLVSRTATNTDCRKRPKSSMEPRTRQEVLHSSSQRRSFSTPLRSLPLSAAASFVVCFFSPSLIFAEFFCSHHQVFSHSRCSGRFAVNKPPTTHLFFCASRTSVVLSAEQHRAVNQADETHHSRCCRRRSSDSTLEPHQCVGSRVESLPPVQVHSDKMLPQR